MAERLGIEYVVSVTGLEEARASLNSARGMALQAQSAVNGTREATTQSLPILLMGVRSLNALRLAVEQASKAITTFDPRAALYSFLNMIQVVRNLITLTRMLKESTGAAAAAEAVLAALTGRWWLIPLAIAAGAAIYAHIRSMQQGGIVEETGLYLLHRGEVVLPASHIHNYGPIYITFERQPHEGVEVEEFLRSLGRRMAERMRRYGG
ncbi:hypothetical protein DRO56_02285 [Candidatus Bathyarchaeota archaeon]|nr:MAG: hypothetical protein CW700_07770 [Candidatus Bathyarchaeota archaeon]RLI33199.1 MAG: hypothetical protein DRO56_02285 [Candidatus Bathyarchaeota archaeon]